MATCAPGTRLSAAIFAFPAAERLRRPVGPSITSSRLTRLAFETSNWTSILPSAIMLLPRWSEVSFAPSCHAPHEGISEAHTNNFAHIRSKHCLESVRRLQAGLQSFLS